jgi:AcrR family transcriptional regulator
MTASERYDGSMATAFGTREIGRHAVRAELARVAFENFCLTGFDGVTFADLAEVTGVSRSTFLRYFGTKEDMVLFVFDPVGDVLEEAVSTSEAADDWGVLHDALAAAVSHLTREVGNLSTILDLIGKTPALCARLSEKQAAWRARVVAVLGARPTSSPRSTPLAVDVRVAAALESLWIILEAWRAGGGAGDALAFIDGAIEALTAR